MRIFPNKFLRSFQKFLSLASMSSIEIYAVIPLDKKSNSSGNTAMDRCDHCECRLHILRMVSKIALIPKDFLESERISVQLNKK